MKRVEVVTDLGRQRKNLRWKVCLVLEGVDTEDALCFLIDFQYEAYDAEGSETVVW